MLEGYFFVSSLQAFWHPGFQAFFVFCHLSCLGPAANPFLAEFFRYKFLHITIAMAGYQMPMAHRFEQGFLPQTAVDSKWTTCMKPASGGRINGTGNVSGQNDTPLLTFDVGNRNGR